MTVCSNRKIYFFTVRFSLVTGIMGYMRLRLKIIDAQQLNRCVETTRLLIEPLTSLHARELYDALQGRMGMDTRLSIA
ncbi:MAG: hypothetical protein NT027_02015 [Proteobacteria bacterium]|nr:hypothetical protein [Pseudomonadota bacterium]